MFRSSEWSVIRRSTSSRRILSVGALALLTVGSTALPAAAACVEGSTTHSTASVLGTHESGAGFSEAEWDHNPGPNTSGPVTTVPFSDVIDFGQGGGMQSVSTATSDRDGSALTGFVGADGQVTFDRTDGGFAPAEVDLLALMRQGGADLSDSLVDVATLRLGIGGAEVTAVDGVVQDPDGVGGPGRYRVGQADIDLHSPKIEAAAAHLYDAVGAFDDVTERTVNDLLKLTTATSALPTGTSLTARVRSDVQEEVFRDIVARPITTRNKVLTVDFSTGTATLHLDQLLHGEERVDGPLLPGQDARPGDPTGLNAQHPNTEIIDDEIYPMIAETVHDLMDEVVTIAVGAVEGALASATVDFTATTKNALGSAVARWSVNLMGKTVAPATCTPTGPGGPALCTLLTSVINTVVAPLATKALVPVRDALLSDAGANLYGLAVEDVKTGLITVPVRQALEPFIETLAQNVSLQVNSQRTSYCTEADGTRRLSGVKLSAASVAFRRNAGGQVYGFGNAGVTTRCDGVISN